MLFSAGQIAQIIGGTIEGDETVTVSSFGKIEDAQIGQLSFLANPKYEEFLYSTKADIIIINENLQLKNQIKATLIRVPDAYSAFAILLDKYQQIRTQQLSGVQEPVYLHPTAKIGENVYLAAMAYKGGIS